MSSPLTEEMILFMKHVLTNFENVRTRVCNSHSHIFNGLLNEIGYDGTLSSVVDNDDFWNDIMVDILEYWRSYEQLKNYKFSLLEKTLDGILPYIKLSEEDYGIDDTDIIMLLMDYMITKWNTRMKEPLKLWAQMEFSLSPK